MKALDPVLGRVYASMLRQGCAYFLSKRMEVFANEG